MSHTSLLSTQDESGKAYLTELASIVEGMLAHEQRNGPIVFSDELAKAILQSELSLDDPYIKSIVSIIKALIHNSEPITRVLHTVSLHCIAYMLLSSNEGAKEIFGLNVLLEDSQCKRQLTSAESQDFFLKDSISLSLLQCQLVERLCQFFVDETLNTKFRILAGKAIAEIMMALKDTSDILPKFQEEACSELAYIARYDEDVAMRFYAWSLCRSSICRSLSTTKIQGEGFCFPDDTIFQGALLKNIQEPANDTMSLFYSYTRDIELIPAYTGDLQIEKAKYPWHSCHVLQSIRINNDTLAKGTVLVVWSIESLTFISSLGHGLNQYFEHIEVPLEHMRWSITPVNQSKEEKLQLDLHIDQAELIFINGRNPYFGEAILSLSSDVDLTKFLKQLEELSGRLRVQRELVGPVLRKASIIIPLDTPEEIARKSNHQQKGPQAKMYRSDDLPIPNKMFSNILNRISDIDDAPALPEKVPKATLPNTQDSLIFPVRRHKRKVYTATSKATIDWEEDLRPSDDASKSRADNEHLALPTQTSGSARKNAAAGPKRQRRRAFLSKRKSKPLAEKFNKTRNSQKERNREPSGNDSLERFKQRTLSLASKVDNVVDTIEGSLEEQIDGRGQTVGKKLAAAFEIGVSPDTEYCTSHDSHDGCTSDESERVDSQIAVKWPVKRERGSPKDKQLSSLGLRGMQYEMPERPDTITEQTSQHSMVTPTQKPDKQTLNHRKMDQMSQRPRKEFSNEISNVKTLRNISSNSSVSTSNNDMNNSGPSRNLTEQNNCDHECQRIQHEASWNGSSIGLGSDEGTQETELLGDPNEAELEKETDEIGAPFSQVNSQIRTNPVAERSRTTPKMTIVDKNGSPRLVPREGIESTATKELILHSSLSQSSSNEQSESHARLYDDESGYDAESEEDATPPRNSYIRPKTIQSAKPQRTLAWNKLKDKMGRITRISPNHLGRRSSDISNYGKIQSNSRVQQILQQIQRNGQLKTTQQRAKRIIKASNEQLERQLEDEKEAVDLILKEFRRQLLELIDILRDAREERMELYQRQIDTLREKHTDMCVELINRIEGNELGVRKRAHPSDFTSRQGQKRRKTRH